MSEASVDEAQFVEFFMYALTETYIDGIAMSAYITMLVNAAPLMHKLGLFVYDSIISYKLEWRAVWTRKMTGATALYLALRYVTLVNFIMFILVSTIVSCEG